MALLETPVEGAVLADQRAESAPVDSVHELRGVLLVVAVALFVVAAVTGGLVPSVAVGLLYLVGVALLSTSPGGLPGRSALVLGAAHVAAAAVLALL
ncbi:MAG: hypothetical protein GY929_18410 [Actinomycetia bacterium]|nr:hypothetical protein [Actinomycetes bacterium]